MEPFSEIDLSAPEIGVIAGGLYTVALVDGLHEREVAFISEVFHRRPIGWAFGEEGETPAAIPAGLAPLDPSALVALLRTSAHRQLFLKVAYLLAWADGKVSFAERASIDAFASALGVTSDALTGLESEVKDHLRFSGFEGSFDQPLALFARDPVL